jgi:hypothetical protein
MEKVGAIMGKVSVIMAIDRALMAKVSEIMAMDDPLMGKVTALMGKVRPLLAMDGSLMGKVGPFLATERSRTALECPLMRKKCTLTEKVSEIKGKASLTMASERLTAGIE